MRMLHYFAGLAGLASLALIATAATGLLGAGVHLGVGLFGALAAVGAHTLLILFMIITGRVLREAMVARNLPAGFLEELNVFFGRKAAYPMAIFAVLAVVVAAVLGYGHRGFDLAPALHMLAGVAAIVLNLFVFLAEYRALAENQRLLDRAAEELDAIDRELEERGELVDTEDVPAPAAVARGALSLAIGAWLPYLYWALIVWKGDFSAVSLHPWIELSIAGVAVWLTASRSSRRTSESPAEEAESPRHGAS